MENQKNTVIAPIGNNPEALFIGMREIPTHKVILLVEPGSEKVAGKITKELEKFKIKIKTKELENPVWEEMFRIIGEIAKQEVENNLFINVATGNSNTRCAATSAAFVNGIKAFSVDNNETMMLPVLKFSYYRILTEKKMQILKIIEEDKTCCKSLEELSQKTKMSLPLISYHVNGTYKSEGLKKLGLVELKNRKGTVSIGLTTLGRLLIKGYVK